MARACRAHHGRRRQRAQRGRLSGALCSAGVQCQESPVAQEPARPSGQPPTRGRYRRLLWLSVSSWPKAAVRDFYCLLLPGQACRALLQGTLLRCVTALPLLIASLRQAGPPCARAGSPGTRLAAVSMDDPREELRGEATVYAGRDFGLWEIIGAYTGRIMTDEVRSLACHHA